MGDTISFKRPASLLAMIFVTNFAKLWTKLIGLKSFGCSATSFFGTSVIYAVLRTENPINFLLQIAETTAIMFYFIIGQQDL
jgi:hypothetical protein